jgi:hypothetical protein
MKPSVKPATKTRGNKISGRHHPFSWCCINRFRGAPSLSPASQQIYRLTISTGWTSSVILEEHADTFTVVHPANRFGEHVANLQDLELGARLEVLLLGHGVGGDDFVDGAGVDALDGIAREYAVSDECIHGLGTFLLQELGGACDGVGGIGQVIDEDGGAATDFTDEQHCGVLTIRDLCGAAFLKCVR